MDCQELEFNKFHIDVTSCCSLKFD